MDSLPVCVMENAGTRRTLQWQKNVKLCREFRILAGIAEVSTGVMQIAGLNGLSGILLFNTEIKTLITIGLCAFGGISSVAQTYSVISDTNLSIKDYMTAKIRQAFIAVVLALLVFRI